MSYLHTPRLIFSGDFMANVSTANNDVTHYNNQTFQPEYQQQGIIGPPPTNGWWNPEGTAAFEFRNCSVKKITRANGISFTDPEHDPVIGLKVAGADSRSPGKMTDLDPQMQMCSQLWGVKVCLFNASGVSIMETDLLTSPFNDLQLRQYKDPVKNGQPYGGTWTSVLANIKWGKQADESVFLKELRATSQHNKLSFNMHQFGYYKTPGSRFCLGRVLGSIGPYFAGEPEMFAPARRLYGIHGANKLQSIFSYSNFIVEKQTKSLQLDLGGSFPLLDPKGGIEPIWSLTVAVANTPVLLQMSPNAQTITRDHYTPIGELGRVWENNWLNQSGGIVSFFLPEEILLQLRSKQLLLIAKTTNGLSAVVARESENGFMIRADNPVLRIDEGEQKESQVWVYQWGEPVSATVELTLVAPAKTNFGGNANVPLTGTPTDAVKFPATVTTDGTGKADIFISGSGPGNPRGYIDGQVYFINYQVFNQPNPSQYLFDQLVVHLRDHYQVPDNPSWDDVKEIWQQFSNLYPIMSKYVVDLGNMKGLIKKSEILIFAFTRDINDPICMPATRDLSSAKIKTLVKWLRNPLPGTAQKVTYVAESNQQAEEIVLQSSLAAPKSANEVAALGEAKSGFRIPEFNFDLPFSI